MELNEQGEYESVETQTKADVPTGGVFMMRQVGIVLTCDMIVMSYNIPVLQRSVHLTCLPKKGDRHPFKHFRISNVCSYTVN